MEVFFVIIYSIFSIFPSPTMTEQLCVRCLLEDDDGRPKRGEGHVQATAAREGPELRGEVLQVGIRRITKELKKVIVETVRLRAVDDKIRNC